MSEFWMAFAFCVALFGLTGQLALARASHHKHVPARAAPYAAFAAPLRYQAPTNVCKLRWGNERPEELAQDRGIEDDIGNSC